MRILHVTTFLHPERPGGAERVVAALARAQAERGDVVTVLTSSHAPGPLREGRGGVTVVRYPLPPGVRGVAFLRAVSRGTKAGLAGLTGERHDVVHVHQLASAAPTLTCGIAGVSDRLRVLSFYAPYAEERAAERGSRSPWSLLANAAAARLDRACLRGADLVHVLSPAATAQVARLAPEVAPHVRCIPPGVDARFAPTASESRPPSARDGTIRLLTVRRLVRRMGLDDLITAVRRVRDAGRDVHLDIAGTGPEEGRLRSAIHVAALDAHVTLLGHVEEPRLPDLYRSADLFVLPTRALEGFGMATLEALASGLPVVGTRVGATPELLARWLPEAPCVTPGSESLGDGILDALSRRDVLEVAAKRAASAIAAESSWRVVADRMSELYHGAN